jgi:hypothetical protein
VGLQELQRAVAALDDVVSCTGTVSLDERLSIIGIDGFTDRDAETLLDAVTSFLYKLAALEVTRPHVQGHHG